MVSWYEKIKFVNCVLGKSQMKKYKRLVVAVILCFAAATEAESNKVLIIGIDGCRSDALLTANTPNIDKLWRNGAFCFYTQTDSETVSAPCWTSMLTGVWSETHGIRSNSTLKELEHPPAEYPHFFERVKKHNPNLVTASVVNWSIINKLLKPEQADIIESFDSDRDVSERAVAILTQNNPDVLFIQFDEVDGAGHNHSYGPHSPNYISAIETTDTFVGNLIAAIENRPSYKDENWLILVTADHGGLKTGHGRSSPQERTVFFIAYGKSVETGELIARSAVTDIAVTAMAHMDIPIDFRWNLDGKIQAIKKDQTEFPLNSTSKPTP